MLLLAWHPISLLFLPLNCRLGEKNSMDTVNNADSGQAF